MSAVVLDALVGPHPVYGVGLNFGAVLQLKTACQNALGASSKEIEDGAQKYAAWGSSPEAGGSKRWWWPASHYDHPGFCVTYLEKNFPARVSRWFHTLIRMFKRPFAPGFKAWVLDLIRSRAVAGSGVVKIRAVAAGGGPGQELVALRAFLAWVVASCQDELGVVVTKLELEGYVVDPSSQWEVTARVLHHEYVATSFWSFLSDPASSLASTTQSAQLQRLVGAICTADFVLLGYLLSDFPPPRGYWEKSLDALLSMLMRADSKLCILDTHEPRWAGAWIHRYWRFKGRNAFVGRVYIHKRPRLPDMNGSSQPPAGASGSQRQGPQSRSRQQEGRHNRSQQQGRGNGHYLAPPTPELSSLTLSESRAPAGHTNGGRGAQAGGRGGPYAGGRGAAGGGPGRGPHGGGGRGRGRGQGQRPGGYHQNTGNEPWNRPGGRFLALSAVPSPARLKQQQQY